MGNHLHKFNLNVIHVYGDCSYTALMSIVFLKINIMVQIFDQISVINYVS